jgi:hypothetical protein
MLVWCCIMLLVVFYFLFVVVVVIGMDLMGFGEDYFLVLVVFGEELFVD